MLYLVIKERRCVKGKIILSHIIKLFALGKKKNLKKKGRVISSDFLKLTTEYSFLERGKAAAVTVYFTSFH